MFKIGVVTDEISQDFERVVQVAVELGLDALEVRSVGDRPPQDLTDDEIETMRARAGEAGLTFCGIATPFYKCDIDDADERREHLRILRDCAALGRRFGTNLLRCFAFWNTGSTEARWREILDAFEEPLQVADDEGMILGMENEASTSLSTAALTRRFIDELDHPRVRAIWDPANELYADGGVTPYPDGFETLRDVMVHGHIKDGARNDDGEMVSVAVGEGLVDWPGQLQRFVDDGYGGFLSLETHWRPAHVLSEGLLNRPGGTAFSEAAEEATRTCVANLRRMMATIGDGGEDMRA